MIRRIAEAAAWLDKQGLYADADTMTEVLRRYAIDQTTEEGDQPDDTDWVAELSHKGDLDLTDPATADLIAAYNPARADFVRGLKPRGAFTETELAKGEDFIQYGPYKIRIPKGSKTKLEPIAHELFMSPDMVQANYQQTLDRLMRGTRGGTRAATFDVDYMSPSGKPISGRKLVFDPRAEQLARSINTQRQNVTPFSMLDRENLEHQGKNVLLYPRDMYRGLLLPGTDISQLEDLDDQERESILSALRGKPRTTSEYNDDEDVESGTEPYSLPQLSEPYSLPQLSDRALRNFKLSRFLAIRPRPSDVNPETGQRIRHKYRRF